MTRPAPDTQSMTTSGLNLIKQAMSIFDADLHLVLANRQMQKMFDLPDHLVQPGTHFETVIRHLAQRGDYGAVTDLDTFLAERVAQARTFAPHYFERDRSNGTTISVEGSPLREGGWVAVYTDITEIKRQEALLRDRSVDLSETLIARSEELSHTNRALTATVTALEEAKHALTISQDRLNLTNSMIPAHIARVGRDGVYTYSNRKLDSVIPDRSNDVLGRHMRDALGPEVFAEIEPCVQKALAGEAPVKEFELPDQGRHIRVAFTPDSTSAGITGVYILSMDVTEEANARAALTHSRRRELAAQLTSGMAHDFANLLTIILGQQSRLAPLAATSPALKEISDTIHSAARRGGVLLDGLSQIDAQRSLNVTAVAVADFVTSLEQLAQAATPDQVQLDLQSAIQDSHLMFDAGFAQDALLNLVLNAVEAMDGPGKVSVSFARTGDALWQMTVTDTGPGFSDHALRNALTPFYTSKGGQLGRGLGLSTAFDFAKSSGGTIRLANMDKGGAKVTLRIPYTPSTPVTPGLVLLVEDTDEIREALRHDLRRMGHAVIEATEAKEAARLAAMPGVTHIISDLMLDDGTTGLDLSQTLEACGRHIPMTVITGLPPRDALRQAAAKRHTVLTKPVSYDTLVGVFTQ